MYHLKVVHDLQRKEQAPTERPEMKRPTNCMAIWTDAVWRTPPIINIKAEIVILSRRPQRSDIQPAIKHPKTAPQAIRELRAPCATKHIRLCDLHIWIHIPMLYIFIPWCRVLREQSIVERVPFQSHYLWHQSHLFVKWVIVLDDHHVFESLTAEKEATKSSKSSVSGKGEKKRVSMSQWQEDGK